MYRHDSTVKARAKRQYQWLLMSAALVGLTFGIGELSGSSALQFAGASLLVATLILTAVLFNSWRCPQCRQRIDLRGPGAFCPKCGVWIPEDHDEPPQLPV